MNLIVKQINYGLIEEENCAINLCKYYEYFDVHHT